MNADERVAKIDNAVNDIMNILTQEGMTYGLAEIVFFRVQKMMMASSENFIQQKPANEVLKSRR